ncbi:MAG: DNA polymerase III subunit delta [Gammaproteobacteria bacterium]
MKLNPDQLSSHLKKTLAPLYLISGDEPLLISEVTDEIRAAARAAGCEDREVHVVDARSKWDEIVAGTDNLSLFSSRQLIELRMPSPKPGRTGGAALTALAENPSEDTVFIISTGHLDARTAKSKWVSALAKGGVWLPVRPVPAAQLPGWLAARFKRAGLSCDKDALQLLAARVEGNLLAACQEIEKLALLSENQHVTADDIQNSVADGARYDVFQLADAALAQQTSRAIHILRGLQREGIAAPLVLWALAREVSLLLSLWSRVDQGVSLQRAMDEQRIWKSRQGVIARNLRGHSAHSIEMLLNKACHVDRVVKGARYGQPWNELQDLAMGLADPAVCGRWSDDRTSAA